MPEGVCFFLLQRKKRLNLFMPCDKNKFKKPAGINVFQEAGSDFLFSSQRMVSLHVL